MPYSSDSSSSAASERMCASFCRSTSLKRRAGGLEGRPVLAPLGAGAVVPAFGFEHLSPAHVPSFVHSSSPAQALSEQGPCAHAVSCDGALAGAGAALP